MINGLRDGPHGPLRQALLSTSRIRLVPLSDEHLEHEADLDSDPEVMRYPTGRAGTREQWLAR